MKLLHMKECQLYNNNNSNYNGNTYIQGGVVALDKSYLDEVNNRMSEIAMKNSVTQRNDGGDLNKQFGNNLQDAFSVEDVVMDDIVQHMETKR